MSTTRGCEDKYKIDKKLEFVKKNTFPLFQFYNMIKENPEREAQRSYAQSV